MTQYQDYLKQFKTVGKDKGTEVFNKGREMLQKSNHLDSEQAMQFKNAYEDAREYWAQQSKTYNKISNDLDKALGNNKTNTNNTPGVNTTKNNTSTSSNTNLNNDNAVNNTTNSNVENIESNKTNKQNTSENNNSDKENINNTTTNSFGATNGASDEQINKIPTIDSIAKLKAAGSTVNALTSLIEHRYAKNGDVDVKGNTVYGIDDKGYYSKWIIDDAGNPIKTHIRYVGIKQDNSGTDNQNITNNNQKDNNLNQDTNSEVEKQKQKIDNKAKQYLSDPNTLTSDIKNGTVDEAALSKISTDPYAADKARKAYIEKIGEDIKNGRITLDSLTKNLSDLTRFIDYITGDFKKRIEDAFDSDEVQGNRARMAVLVKDISKLVEEKSKISAEMHKKYAGKPEGFIQAAIQAKTAEIQAKIDGANNELGNTKMMHDVAVGDIKAELGLYQAATQQQIGVFTNVYNNWFKQKTLATEHEYTIALQKAKTDTAAATAWTALNIGSGAVMMYNKSTGEYKPVSITNSGQSSIKISDGTVITNKGLDFSNSSLAMKYPKEASFKNNNTSGISWNFASKELKNKWAAVGVDFSEGTARQEGGGNYVKFGSVLDGIEAQRITLDSVGYKSVKDRLEAWVGGDAKKKKEYAESIMKEALGKDYRDDITFDDLTPTQEEKLISAQIRRESPGMFKELQAKGVINEDGSMNLDTAATISNNPTIRKSYEGNIVKLGQKILDGMDLGKLSNMDAKRVEAKIARYVKNGDYKSLYQEFRRNMMKDKDFKKDYVGNVTFLQGLNELKEKLKDLNTGASTGAKEWLWNKFGLTTDEQIAEFNTQLGALLADYIRSISGTAASDREVKRLIDLLPKIKNSKDYNNAIITGMISRVEAVTRTKVETEMGFNKDLASKVFYEVYKDDGYFQSSNGFTIKIK